MRIVKGRTVKDRKGIIGGSQVASILGIPGAYSTPFEVWKTFTGNDDDDDRKKNSLMMAGTYIEYAIAKMYEDMEGVKLHSLMEGKAWQHDKYDWAICHPDRYISKRTAVEIKNISFRTAGDWGESGTDGVPMYYMTQALWYMAVNDELKNVIVVRYTDGQLYKYDIKRKGNEDLIEGIFSKVKETVDRWIAGVVPERTNLNEEYSFRTIRGFGEDYEIRELPTELKMLGSEYLQASREEKVAKVKKEAALMKMGVILGDNKSFRSGKRNLLQWVEKTTVTVDKDRLMKEHTDIYRELTKVSKSTYLKANLKDEDVVMTAEDLEFLKTKAGETAKENA